MGFRWCYRNFRCRREAGSVDQCIAMHSIGKTDVRHCRGKKSSSCTAVDHHHSTNYWDKMIKRLPRQGSAARTHQVVLQLTIITTTVAKTNYRGQSWLLCNGGLESGGYLNRNVFSVCELRKAQLMAAKVTLTTCYFLLGFPHIADQFWKAPSSNFGDADV